MSPLKIRIATKGSSGVGDDDVSSEPWNDAVGANRPSSAIWFFRRSSASGYRPAGVSKRAAPEESIVWSSSGTNGVVWVRFSPLGKVTVNVGAKPLPST